MDLKVVSREMWGAAPARSKESLEGCANRVIIHHTDTPGCKGLSECKERLCNIQRFHMKEKNFDDIGYNFLVGGDGTVFEGRGWGVVGAHAKHNNHDSVGIAFIGNFNNDTPSKEAISSVQQLLQSGVSEGFLQPEFTVNGHRDLGQTECPGSNLYDALPQLKGANYALGAKSPYITEGILYATWPTGFAACLKVTNSLHGPIPFQSLESESAVVEIPQYNVAVKSKGII